MGSRTAGRSRTRTAQNVIGAHSRVVTEQAPGLDLVAGGPGGRPPARPPARPNGSCRPAAPHGDAGTRMVGTVPTWGGRTRRARARLADLRRTLAVAAVVLATTAAWLNWQAGREEAHTDALGARVAAAEGSIPAERARLAARIAALDESVAALTAALAAYRSLAGGEASGGGYADLQGPVRRWIDDTRSALDVARDRAIAVSEGTR